jgi:hypothetical protein
MQGRVQNLLFAVKCSKEKTREKKVLFWKNGRMRPQRIFRHFPQRRYEFEGVFASVRQHDVIHLEETTIEMAFHRLRFILDLI